MYSFSQVSAVAHGPLVIPAESPSRVPTFFGSMKTVKVFSSLRREILSWKFYLGEWFWRTF